MGMFDKMSGPTSEMSDGMKARYEMLKQQEQDGSIDDHGRRELAQMRARFIKED